METTGWLDALERDGDAFAESCSAARLGAPVAACPEWDVADLVWHLGEVHQFWRTIVSERRSSPDGVEQPARPADDDLLDFYRSGLHETVNVLRAAEPTDAVWTWSNDKTAGFVVRRMAHETAMHRWDADQAAGRDVPVEAELASDGIDEFLQHMIHDVADGAAPVGGSVHIHCGDVAGEWTIRPDGTGGMNVTREHAKGDCAIRGNASDILLALWRRRPLSTVEVIGDGDVAARFIARTSLD